MSGKEENFSFSFCRGKRVFDVYGWISPNGMVCNIHMWPNDNAISLFVVNKSFYFYGEKARNFLIEQGPLFNNALTVE